MNLTSAWDDGKPRFKHQVPTRKKTKSQKARAEAKVKKRVRAECVDRDGYCLVQNRTSVSLPNGSGCEGPSTWAHFAGHRRSQTRGMAPEKRHDTRFSGMLCERHHGQEESGQYEVVYRSADYANGPIDWQPREQKAAS